MAGQSRVSKTLAFYPYYDVQQTSQTDDQDILALMHCYLELVFWTCNQSDLW